MANETKARERCGFTVQGARCEKIEGHDGGHIATPAPAPVTLAVPLSVHEHGWQWRPVTDDTVFAPPFGTIRACSGCGCLVAGGPTTCGRCAEVPKLHDSPSFTPKELSVLADRGFERQNDPHVATTVDYDELDPGIRETVRWLTARHFRTTDSGDGVTKPAAARTVEGPHVFLRYDHMSVAEEADRLAFLLRHAGVRVTEGTIQATYDPMSLVQVIGLFGVDDAALRAAGAL